MAKKISQQYGIKFPYTKDLNYNYFVDTNLNIKSKIRSILMHVIFTPKGQKLRDPEFGTDLIRMIFEPNDAGSWSNIKSEINNAISKYLPNVTLNNIELAQNEDEPTEVFVKVEYSVKRNGIVETDSIITSI